MLDVGTAMLDASDSGHVTGRHKVARRVEAELINAAVFEIQIATGLRNGPI